MLDANVVLAALAGTPSSPPALLLAAVHSGEVQAVACPRLIEEVRENAGKDYFRARLSELEVDEAIGAYREAAVMFDDPAEIKPVLRDSQDDYLLELACDAGAEAIVTGDKDLLDHPGLRPPALDPRSACERIGLVAPQPG